MVVTESKKKKNLYLLIRLSTHMNVPRIKMSALFPEKNKGSISNTKFSKQHHKILFQIYIKLTTDMRPLHKVNSIKIQTLKNADCETLYNNRMLYQAANLQNLKWYLFSIFCSSYYFMWFGNMYYIN